MRAPFMFRALKLAGEVRSLRRELGHARSMWLKCAEGWAEASEGWLEAATISDGWRARAEILYAMVEDREAVDAAMRAQDGMEEWLRSLEEADPR